ncbi:MAG: SDR family oxidoreductase, partial [Myxococcota bacterium]
MNREQNNERTDELIFVTGATGFLGSYAANVLLNETNVRLAMLTRAKDRQEGVAKLWKAMQLHIDADTFYGFLDRIEFVSGDLTKPKLGIDELTYARLERTIDSVLHIAASLNRKSEKACLNHNLRGTLAVIKLARAAQDHHGLRRFSHVSTVAVAGHRQSEIVEEDEAVDFERSDYDPYGRTKKFCEHMVRELLPDVEKTFLRPSTVMGDSRFAATSQFDMVRAFCVLVDMPIVPFSADGRIDIVNADWVGRAIARIHTEPVKHDTYHLSAGRSSKRAGEIAEALVSGVGRRPPVFARPLEGPFGAIMNQLASSKSKNTATLVGSLFKVFLPYITYDTVFTNERAVDHLGIAPTPFTDYCAELYKYAKAVNYTFPATA